MTLTTPSQSVSLGSALSSGATKVLLCGAGELGKEVAIELQRFGVEVIAVDRYANAPAMHVAHKSYVIDMLDADALYRVITSEKPDYIVPEIEAIATGTLVALETDGFHIIPTARATQLTMNREGIRRLAAEELSIPTSAYEFAETKDEYLVAIKRIGLPLVVKPIMSSSGKGQSVVKSADDIDRAWTYAQDGGRAGAGRVIIEGFVDFDYEITLLTVRHPTISNDSNSSSESLISTSFCEPIGHVQVDGDYQQSWQPQAMSSIAKHSAQRIAEQVTTALGGRGLFGVEFFVKDDEVIFSEVSPRPHDTGLVTLISQDLSEFALHARAILGLPIPEIQQLGPSASAVILGQGKSNDIRFSHVNEALNLPNTQLRLFGKPNINGKRRLGVSLAKDESIEAAIEKATQAAAAVTIKY